MSGNVIRVTPFMHVEELDTALKFMTETLGFAVDFRQPGYAYVSLEDAGLRILESPGCGRASGWRFAYYFDVHDVGAVYERLLPRLRELPPGDVRGPVDQHYRQRELMVRAPDGLVLVFGQGISA